MNSTNTNPNFCLPPEGAVQEEGYCNQKGETGSFELLKGS